MSPPVTGNQAASPGASSRSFTVTTPEVARAMAGPGSCVETVVVGGQIVAGHRKLLHRQRVLYYRRGVGRGIGSSALRACTIAQGGVPI